MHEVWWVFIIHYLHEGAIEFMADVGDHFVSHYVMIVFMKVGAAHVVAVVVHKVFRRDKGGSNVD